MNSFVAFFPYFVLENIAIIKRKLCSWGKIVNRSLCNSLVTLSCTQQLRLGKKSIWESVLLFIGVTQRHICPELCCQNKSFSWTMPLDFLYPDSNTAICCLQTDARWEAMTSFLLSLVRINRHLE